MNTWGQKTSEYLGRVGALAQLAGARHLLVANEVNAAYVSGGLRSLRIPYAVSRGNHTMARWEEFYANSGGVVDDGPLRIVTGGNNIYEDWESVSRPLKARHKTSCRVLIPFEHNTVPLNVVTDTEVDLLFDGHCTRQHPQRARFPQGTLGFRAPGQQTLRWIPMTRDGLAVDAVKNVPVLRIPRQGPSPLRMECDRPNDGTASRMTARVINSFPVAFANGRPRFVMRHGTYRVDGGKIFQQFHSDDGRFTVVDVESSFPPRSRTVITVVPLPKPDPAASNKGE
jgi:hypothetical protein